MLLTAISSSVGFFTGEAYGMVATDVDLSRGMSVVVVGVELRAGSPTPCEWEG